MPPPGITLGGACVLSVLLCTITVLVLLERVREGVGGVDGGRKGVREEHYLGVSLSVKKNIV